ncbi:MAG: PQQ-binding-like beta-propeller repeat protein [Chitinispirillales bacterium]|jgi:outer membrane protein assembly factor BamB|nr:PQQ-binding-like beta-propeller repeat protein [Chitinispirillales bacterium]
MQNDNNNLPLPTGRPWFWSVFIFANIVWIVVLFWWFLDKPVFEITERIPGTDGEPLDASAADVSSSSTIGSIFYASDDPPPPSSVKTSWPHFRGIGVDNISVENIPLRDFADGSSPTVLWAIDLGEGHAAPAVHNGRVYVLDYDEEAEADILRCLSLDTGEEIWRRGYNVKVRRNHGMSRTIPAVTDSAVVTIGPQCHVMAVHAVSGDFLWGIDLVREYGTEVPLWYTGQCPFIDDTVAVIAPAGPQALLIGVHKMTGEVLWETPNRHNWRMSHSSVIPMEFYGRRIYVYVAIGGIVGVAADGEDRGSILFETSDFNNSVVAPSPVPISGDRIFMTAGYGAGSAMFRINYNQGDDKFSITMTDRFGVRDALASEQQTPLYYNNLLCAVLPKDAGAHRDQFVCADALDPTTIRWTSGQDELFGLGPFIIANDKFYILSDDGILTVASISDRRFEKRGSVRISNGVDAWGPMALVEGRLLLRDSRRMFCIDLRYY